MREVWTCFPHASGATPLPRWLLITMNISVAASTSSSVARCATRLSSTTLRTHFYRGLSHKSTPSLTPALSARRTFASAPRLTSSTSSSSSLNSVSSSTSSMDVSTPPRAFTFHVGASFIGKPKTSEDGPQAISKPFPPEHPVVAFRDRNLAWPREVPSEEAGHDFFFVQQVS